jgi:hypothetical protein
MHAFPFACVTTPIPRGGATLAAAATFVQHSATFPRFPTMVNKPLRREVHSTLNFESRITGAGARYKVAPTPQTAEDKKLQGRKSLSYLNSGSSQELRSTATPCRPRLTRSALLFVSTDERRASITLGLPKKKESPDKDIQCRAVGIL